MHVLTLTLILIASSGALHSWCDSDCRDQTADKLVVAYQISCATGTTTQIRTPYFHIDAVNRKCPNISYFDQKVSKDYQHLGDKHAWHELTGSLVLQQKPHIWTNVAWQEELSVTKTWQLCCLKRSFVWKVKVTKAVCVGRDQLDDPTWTVKPLRALMQASLMAADSDWIL